MCAGSHPFANKALSGVVRFLTLDQVLFLEPIREQCVCGSSPSTSAESVQAPHFFSGQQWIDSFDDVGNCRVFIENALLNGEGALVAREELKVVFHNHEVERRNTSISLEDFTEVAVLTLLGCGVVTPVSSFFTFESGT